MRGCGGGAPFSRGLPVGGGLVGRVCGGLPAVYDGIDGFGFGVRNGSLIACGGTIGAALLVLDGSFGARIAFGGASGLPGHVALPGIVASGLPGHVALPGIVAILCSRGRFIRAFKLGFHGGFILAVSLGGNGVLRQSPIYGPGSFIGFRLLRRQGVPVGLPLSLGIRGFLHRRRGFLLIGQRHRGKRRRHRQQQHQRQHRPCSPQARVHRLSSLSKSRAKCRGGAIP